MAFEADDPARFLDLVQRLRTTEASAYTKRDTPTFTCVATSVERALAALDGAPLADGLGRPSGDGARGRSPRSSRPSSCSRPACGGGDDAPQDPITQVPTAGGLQEKVRAGAQPSADAFPAAGGKPAGARRRDRRRPGDGPGQLRLRGRAREPPRLRHHRPERRLPLRPDRRLRRAHAGRARPGPVPGAGRRARHRVPFRSQAGRDGGDPFAAVYAAQVPLREPGAYSVMAVSLVDGKPVAAPARSTSLAPRADRDPGGRRARRRAWRRTRSLGARRPRRDRHARSRPARPAREFARRGAGQEARRAAVRHAAAVRVARVRARGRRGAPARGPLRRPDRPSSTRRSTSTTTRTKGCASRCSGSGCGRSRGCS